MKFRIKNLLFFPLIFIVNGKPFNQADYTSLYSNNINNRILNPNYGGFINTIHVDNNANVPLVHYDNIMNNNMRKQGIKYANLNAQDAGMKDNRQSLDNRNEILEPSENTFYELYTPLVSIYRSYPVDLYQQQQQQLIHDIEHKLIKPENSRLLDALFSIESVPIPNPLILLSEPSPLHQQQHSSVHKPTTNLRRFSFQMPAFPSFENSFNVFPQNGGFPSFPQIGGFSNFPHNGGFSPANSYSSFQPAQNSPSYPQSGKLPNIGFPLQNKGYSYPAPSKNFPLHPQTNNSPSNEPNKGYSYPPPSKSFPLHPQTNNSPSNEPNKGYIYPQPSIGFPSFSQGWQYPSFPDMGYAFPKMDFTFPKMDFNFPDMDNVFKNTFDHKRFEPEVIQDSMKDENGNTPDLIQVGKNNKNIKSGNQHGIVQVNMRKSEMPIITTTEFPDVEETSTLPEETTTFLDESIDRIDEILKKSLAGK